MSLLLYALIAAVYQPAQAAIDPQLICINLSINSLTDPLYYYVAQATFHHPAFSPRTRGYAEVGLDGTLPDPLGNWRLVEINPDPGPKPATGYVILRNEETGGLAVLAVEQRDIGHSATRQAKSVTLRPSTRPAPSWPGIGCVIAMPDPQRKGDNRLYAELVAGEYVAEDDLGWFRDDQLLPKPWNDWRVSQVFSTKNLHGILGPRVFGVMLHNEKTGQTVEVLQKGIGRPPRATTHPSDDLMAAATQPAGAK